MLTSDEHTHKVKMHGIPAQYPHCIIQGSLHVVLTGWFDIMVSGTGSLCIVEGKMMRIFHPYLIVLIKIRCWISGDR